MMSRAFVKNDVDVPDAGDALPPRPSAPAPITARGARALADELSALPKESRRARQIAGILATVIVTPAALKNAGAGFGCTVDVEHEDGAKRTYEIVGPDEAQPSVGRISVTAPLARALLGQSKGAHVIVEKPQGDERIAVLDVRLLSA
jgi:transcription elongation GreA/GreB family factor